MPLPKAPSLTLLRSLSTTCPRSKATTNSFQNRMPPYPYGPALQYKQSNSGLYGGSSIQFGNIVSSKNAIKNRRTWHPNIHRKRLWSDSLQQFVRVKVQARVLRTIDKVGGLDEYLLGDTPARIKELGVEGWRLRWKVMRTPKVQKRLREERIRLGLPPEGWKQPVTVEDEVERVSGGIVDKLAADEDGDWRELSDEELLNLEPEDQNQYQMTEESESKSIADRQDETPTEEAAKGDSGRVFKVPRLVELAKPEPEKASDDKETIKNGATENEASDVVQADDSRSATGRAFGKIREMFNR